MNDELDINYRPVTYFGPQTLPEHLVAQVKGDAVKKKLGSLYKEGSFDELSEMLETLSVDQSEIKALGSIHPMLMGGITFLTGKTMRWKSQGLQ